MSQARIIQTMSPIFCPPFKGLTAFVWCYFVICCVFYPHGGVLRGELPDTDDYTYLAQILDWLQGQGWFDSVQHRFSPPDGVHMHFTRIIQLPIAAIVFFFKALGLPWIGAATVAAMLWPPVVLILFFASLRWVAEAFVPRDWAGVASYIALFTGPLLLLFAMGRVDHHGVISVLVVLSFGCVTRMIDRPHELKWSALAGFLLATALSIALEMLPWLLSLSSFVGAWLMIKGKTASRAGLVFGLALYFSSALFLFAYRPVDRLMEMDTLAYSMVYVVLTASIALCFAGVSLASQTRFAWLRYVSGVGLGAATAALFFASFPKLIAGPYGAVDAELAQLFLKNISEAIPLIQKYNGVELWLQLLAPMMALAISLQALYSTRGDKAWSWFFISLLIGEGIIMGTFYQERMLNYSYLFGVVPLTFLLYNGWKHIGEFYRGRKRFWAEIGLLLLVGPLPVVLLPAMVDGRPFNIGIGMFPVQPSVNACDQSVLERVLRSPSLYGKKPLTIMNTVDTGPELVFRSRHSVMAAPYHTNVKGNKDALQFFSTNNIEEAEKIARNDRIDLVILCRRIPEMYLGKIGPNQVEIGSNGKVKMKEAASFAERLIYHKVPDWLKEVRLPMLTNYMLFEVLPEANKT